MAHQIAARVKACAGYSLPVCEDYVYKLDMIENHWPASPEVCAAASVADPLWQYPTADGTYRDLVAHMAAYCGVRDEHVVMTNGSDNALRLLVQAFSKEGRPILVLRPTYPHFEHFAATMSDVIWLDYNDGFQVDDVKDKCRARNPSVCYLVSPNLPLGYTIHRARVMAMAAEFPDTIFVVDEAYIEFLRGGGESMAPDTMHQENLVVTRTFSKFFGLASLRLGAVVAHAAVADCVRKLANGKDVTARAARVGLACLKSVDHYQKQLVPYRECMSRIDDTVTNQAAANPEALIYGAICKSGLFYTLLCRNPAYVVDVFKSHGIIVRNKSADVPDAVRVCFASAESADAVLGLCELLQSPRTTWDLASTVRRCTRVCLDLDGTLRDHAQWDETGRSGRLRDMIKSCPKQITLCTNNLIHDPAHIEMIYGAPVITPLDRFANALKNNETRLYVVGPEHCKATLRQQGFVVNDGPHVEAIVVCSAHDIIIDDWQAIGANPWATVYAVEDSELVLDHMCSEITKKARGHQIPDIGMMLNFCATRLGLRISVFGKPSPHMFLPQDDYSNMLVVGDSQTDLNMAESLGCPVVLIDAARDCDFDPADRCPVVSRVEKLFALMKE